MQRILMLAIVVLLLSTPLYAATTVKDRVNPSRDRVWSFVPFGDGQTLITLTWGRRSADLGVLLSCNTDSGFFDFGAGMALQDRVQRIEAGVFGDVCEITVMSFSGSSSFLLSVESGAPDDLTKLLQSGEPGGSSASAGGKLQLIPMAVSDIPGLAEKIERFKAARR